MFYTHSHLNRPFAQYDHMVKDLPCWMTNYTLGLLTQSKYTHSSIQYYFVLDFPLRSLSCYRIVQRVYYFTMYFQGCQSRPTILSVIPGFVVVWVKGSMIGERTYFWASSGYCLMTSPLWELKWLWQIIFQHLWFLLVITATPVK